MDRVGRMSRPASSVLSQCSADGAGGVAGGRLILQIAGASSAERTTRMSTTSPAVAKWCRGTGGGRAGPSGVQGCR